MVTKRNFIAIDGIESLGEINATSFSGGNVSNWDTAYGWGDHSLAGYLTSETTTSISINANTLSYVDEAGNTTNIDLSLYLDDTNLARIASGSVDPSTGIATFTRDDSSSFTVDFSALLDDTNLVTSVNGQTGAVTVSGGISNVVEDTTPQLGGDLDMNGKSFSTNSGASMKMGPTGSFWFEYGPLYTKALQITSAGALVVNEQYTLPAADGTAGQVLTTDGSGNLSFADASGGGASEQTVSSTTLAPYIFDSFDATLFMSGEYYVNITDGNFSSSFKMMVHHDNTNVTYTTYANAGSIYGSISAAIVNNNVQLSYDPESASSKVTFYKQMTTNHLPGVLILTRDLNKGEGVYDLNAGTISLDLNT